MDWDDSTKMHIAKVRQYLEYMKREITVRMVEHDRSKLKDPEAQIFAEYTEKLAGSTYGGKEYKKFLSDMKPALEHHYSVNRHHPEHFKNYNCNGCHTDYHGSRPDRCPVCGYSQMQEESDITQMNLIDLLEMICDWKAASERHNDGDILKSIEINQKRFRYSDELKQILLNTIPLLC